MQQCSDVDGMYDTLHFIKLFTVKRCMLCPMLWADELGMPHLMP